MNLPSDLAIRIKALAGATVLNILGQDTLLSQCLSQLVNLMLQWTSILLGGWEGGGKVETPLVASCYRNWDKHEPAGPLSNHLFTHLFLNFSCSLLY